MGNFRGCETQTDIPFFAQITPANYWIYTGIVIQQISESCVHGHSNVAQYNVYAPVAIREVLLKIVFQ